MANDFNDDFGIDFGASAGGGKFNTSGTSSWTYTTSQIIRRSLRQVGAFASGEAPDARSYMEAQDALNAMIKEWDALGIHLWTESEGILFLQPGQIQYTLGTGSTDFATQTNPPNYAQTTLTFQALVTQTVINVASVAGMLVGDNIGITVNGNLGFFWTTIASINAGALTVTLSQPIPSAGASVGAIVVDYTKQILRPLRVPAARRFYFLTAIETPMVVMSRLDYRDLPNKATPGTPTQLFYDPLGGANQAGLMYVWPAPVDSSNGVKFTWYRQIQDFNQPGNTPDLPQEWNNAIAWNLALELAAEYDCPPDRYSIIKERAAVSLDRAQGWDREPESIHFGVQMDGQPFSR